VYELQRLKHELIKFGSSKPLYVLKTLALAFLILFSSIVLVAQSDKPMPYAHYNFNNGLAAYNSNTIVQDRQGYMWIGTINGLQRFDRHRFLTFRRNPDNKNSLSDNYIDHLMYDSKANLWVVLGNGEVGVFHTRRFVYKPAILTVKDERTLKLPRIITEDSDGNVLYAIYGQELTTYDPAKNEFSSANNFITLPKKWKIISITEDRATKKFWIATDSGMCVYNKKNKLLSYRGNNAEKIPFIDKYGGVETFFNLGVDKRSRFWFTTTNTAGIQLLNCYDLAAEKLVLEKQDLYPDWVMKNYTVEKMLQKSDGSIWIAGLNVLMRYNESRNKFEPVYEEFSKEGISYQEINYLFEDREKDIWASTDNNGLFVLKPSTNLFTSVKQVNRTSGRIDDGSVITIGSFDDKILAAVWNDGIHKYDLSLNALPPTSHEKKLNTIWCMAPLSDKRHIWMGMQSGIMIYDGVTGRAEFFNPSLFSNKLVRTIAEDKYGNIWLGLPNGGVIKWVPEHAMFDFERGFNKIDFLPSAQIEKIRTDSKGFIWVCTLMNGVYKLDPQSNKILDHLTSNGPQNKRLLADAVTDAFEYNDSLMIFPTGNLNILNVKTNEITHISSADGLPSDIVRSIEKDDKNNVWLGMFNGLCRMNLFKKSFTYYDRNDGIANDELNYSSSLRLPDGRLAFGSTRDMLVFDPESLNAQTNPPDVAITEFRLFNRSLNVDSLAALERVELAHDQNFISIGFSGLRHFNNKWSYYYMLDGIDKDWKKVNEISQVDYNYLPSGSYTFLVKAENADGIQSRNISQLRIKVDPPVYKTWWFYSILILFGAVLLFIIDKERMRRKAAMQKMRSDIAGNLHEEVNTALNKINILSEMARLKSDKDPIKSTEYLEQIHTKSHDMIIAMDDMLWSIDPINDSMEKTIERIREFIDALKRRHSANIELLVDKKAETLLLNMRLRHDVFILMKEGIRSVVQAGSKNVRLHIGIQKDTLLYTIDIDNEGCDLQQLTNQLQHRDLEKRLNAIRATLNSYRHQHTTIFELNVPVLS
jgi:ligand-binding sensor domain-containing protein